MKTFFFILLIGSLSLSNIEPSTPIRLTCIVDSLLTQEDQWVYWFSIRGNEYSIIDSCLLKKGQPSFYFQHDFDDDDFMSWLTFSKCGPLQLQLNVAPGENAVIHIVPNSLMYPQAEGSVGTMEMHEQYKETKLINKKIEDLKFRLKITNDEVTTKAIMDSINYYVDFRGMGLDMKLLRTTQSGINFSSILLCIKDDLPKEKVDSLENVMLKRFPNSESVKQYFDHLPTPPASKNSKRAFIRYEELIQKRRHTKSPILNSKSPTKEFLTPQKQALLTVGSQVPDIILKEIDDNEKNLLGMNHKYILIDFWASWCGPCKRGYPELLTIQKKYTQFLGVYAISIDSNLSAWKTAVRSLDPERLFTHVNAIPGSDIAKTLSEQYGITRIPANFLLDQNRRIIATDLSATELDKKLEELILK